MSDASEGKKIFIDEDWKSRVEAEREELTKEEEGADGSEADPSAAAAAAEGAMPPASFEMLITTLATEAMVALGQIPHPATGKREVYLEQARYFIDTLVVLEAKTKGNLSPQETEMLSGVLHQLRLAFVAVQNGATGPSPGPQTP